MVKERTRTQAEEVRLPSLLARSEELLADLELAGLLLPAAQMSSVVDSLKRG